jgi:hypothetical protein
VSEKHCCLCGGAHSRSKCPWANACDVCGKNTKHECGRLECGNRVTYTAHAERNGPVPPRFNPDER